jgi:monofunctional biosynthetic peptidoglycan transglycosylase
VLARWNTLTRPWRIASIAVVLVTLSVVALYVSLPDVRPLATKPPDTTAMIELRKQQAAERGKPFALRWQWRPLARISPYLQHAVVFAEDDKFWKHEGVDWEAMKLAAEHDWHERTVERGASTIAQQLAKNLFLSPSRNPIRKLREILIARRLDRQLGKPRVLELYLNIAEWGDGVFGAEAASRRWFGCSATALRPVQAARLAAALPNPFTRNPDVKSRALTRKAARLVRGMHRAGLIDDEAYEAAERELGIGPPVPEVAPEVPEPESPPAVAEPAEQPEPPEQPTQPEQPEQPVSDDKEESAR